VEEKPRQEHWINAGFMLFDRPVLDILRDENHTDLEKGLLPALARRGELMLYRHHGFWRSMDTYKESLLLEELWEQEQPWKMW
jgi:glucose-1-phosphate cytidylyltransferase